MAKLKLKVGKLYKVIGRKGHYFPIGTLVECIDSGEDIGRFKIAGLKNSNAPTQIIGANELVEIDLESMGIGSRFKSIWE